jgi:CheY-like chemotaxis protein
MNGAGSRLGWITPERRQKLHVSAGPPSCSHPCDFRCGPHFAHRCDVLLFNHPCNWSPRPLMSSSIDLVRLESSLSSSHLRPLFVVDDDEVDRMLFDRLMREADIPHPCRTFSRGEEIIDALIEVLRGAMPPLACFLDVRMPGMNGFDVLRWMRCQHTLDNVPVVMLSSSEETRDLNEARRAAAQCYLAKFPDAEQLRAIVREAERTVAASADTAFKLPCNLLVTTTHVTC